MIGTRRYRVSAKKNPDLYEYCSTPCHNGKKLKNVAFYIERNLHSGLAKEPADRHPNEQAVIDMVCEGIDKHNARGLKTTYAHPTRENSHIDGYVLTTVLQEMKNPDYYAMPGNVNQRVVHNAIHDYSSFFSLLAMWKESGGVGAKPGLPSYVKTSQITVSISRQSALIKCDENGIHWLHLPKTGATLCLGHNLPAGRLQEAKIIPEGEGYRIDLLFDDGHTPKLAEEHMKVFAVDLGVNNFATVANNYGGECFIIDGRTIKSRNRLYNKVMSEIRSRTNAGTEPTKGSTHELPPEAARVSRNRSEFIRDTFYKMAHLICRRARADGVTLIVVGKNRGWKDEANMGARNNQNFVNIPHTKFIDTLIYVGLWYDIMVVVAEESYTSKASFLDDDPIPVYGDKNVPEFSGKRVHRGLYVSADGTRMNSDVNGALNILRKHVPGAFDHVEDRHALVQSVRVYHHDDMNRSARHREDITRHHIARSARIRRRAEKRHANM